MKSIITVFTLSLLLIGISAKVMAEERIIKEINETDKQWLSKSESIGYEVLSRYANTNEVTPDNLDKAFQAWKMDTSEDRVPDSVIASGLGVLFGNYIIKNKNAKWMVVNDSYGTEIAVISANGYETYPVNAVWKRIEPNNEELKFFEPIYTIAVEGKFE
jgi:hypothetical protein